jgi:hypothetical protein
MLIDMKATRRERRISAVREELAAADAAYAAGITLLDNEGVNFVVDLHPGGRGCVIVPTGDNPVWEERCKYVQTLLERLEGLEEELEALSAER